MNIFGEKVCAYFSSLLKMSTSSSSSTSTSKGVKPTLFFFHGLGDCGASWEFQLKSVLPKHIQVKCPTASQQPVTLNGGHKSNSWFDIRSLDMFVEDEQGIKEATKKVHQLIEREEKNGLSAEHIMLGGFSQGGALALYSALTYSKKLAGVMALSCWLPLHKQFPASLSNENKDLHILQFHGDMDFVVAPEHGRATHQVLSSILNKDHVNFVSYPGMQHSSCEEEFYEMKKFVDQHLQPINK